MPRWTVNGVIGAVCVVEAWTKGEARALLKQLYGGGPLPRGLRIELEHRIKRGQQINMSIRDEAADLHALARTLLAGLSVPGMVLPVEAGPEPPRHGRPAAAFTPAELEARLAHYRSAAARARLPLFGGARP